MLKMVHLKVLLLAAVVSANIDAQSPINVNSDVTSESASVTPGPTVDAKGVLGWYAWDGKWLSSDCLPGSTFTTSSKFAGCQKDHKLATACSSNTILYPDGKKSDCDLDRCETATLFESKGAAASSLIQCYATAAFRPEPRTFYRNTFALTTASVTSQPSQTDGVSQTSQPSQTDSISRTSTTSGVVSSSAGTPGTQPTTSAAATPTLAMSGGRAVLWAGLATLFMMGLGVRMVI